MGEASEQATMMQVLNALREEMRVMRQDLGERITRVEQRPPPLQPVRNLDRFLNPNNRRYGVPVHDNPETSTQNQQTDEDTGQQHGPIPNQRAGLQPDDYGEEEEEEGFAPQPRAPRRQNRHQGHVYADMKDLFHLAIQAEQHIKKKSSKSKSQVSWNSSNSNYNKSVDKGKGVEGDSRPKPRTTEPTKDNKTEPAKTTNPNVPETSPVSNVEAEGTWQESAQTRGLCCSPMMAMNLVMKEKYLRFKKSMEKFNMLMWERA
ncbi:unnamed protein product [Brassica napus]|uniref:(rape) hypothetical protein n=1 Tax=Brassica napus TaxID=3708 RepID=A0A816SCC8_BRANA|nr:unnamed protein product [Brassica napus]